METILTLFLIPLLSKIGEPWIEKFAAGVNEQLLVLLRDVAQSQPGRDKEQAEKNLKAYLAEHSKQATKLQESVLRSVATDETALAIGATMVPSATAKLQYFKVLLEWIVAFSRKLQRNVVSLGFIHTPDCLTYYDVMPRAAPLLHSIAGQECLSCGNDLSITVIWQVAKQERKKAFKRWNGLLRDGSKDLAEQEIMQTGLKVGQIFNTWVRFEKLSKADCEQFPLASTGLDILSKINGLPSSPRRSTPLLLPFVLGKYPQAVQDKLRIHNYDGIAAMLESVTTIATEEQKSIVELREVLSKSNL